MVDEQLEVVRGLNNEITAYYMAFLVVFTLKVKCHPQSGCVSKRVKAPRGVPACAKCINSNHLLNFEYFLIKTSVTITVYLYSSAS